MKPYALMTESEQRKFMFRYAELLRFENMRARGGFYFPEDLPSMDEIAAEMATMDAAVLSAKVTAERA